MEKNISMAKELGYLEFDENIIILPEKAKNYKKNKLVILTTGSQGEPMSALSRIAHNQHKFLNIEKGDTVIISASIIPGNEKTVSKVVNSFFKRGASVYYEGFEDLHVSGHASREELKLFLAIFLIFAIGISSVFITPYFTADRYEDNETPRGLFTVFVVTSDNENNQKSVRAVRWSEYSEKIND